MKNRIILGMLIIGSILLPLVKPPNISAGIPMGLPATELTQLQNWILLGKQLSEAAQQLQAEFAHVQWMIYNSKNLTSHPFTSIMGDLTSLSNIVTQSQGLAYGMGQIDQQFAKMYPNYTPHSDYFNQYSDWANNTNNTLRGTLASAGLQGQDLMSEQLVMSKLRQMAQTPMGQTQAIQLGNIASTETISSLAKLRQLQITDIAEKSAYIKYVMQQDAARQQGSTMAYSTNRWTGDNRSW